MCAFRFYARLSRLFSCRLLLAAALAFVLCQACAGCGDDVRIFKPPEEESPFLPLTSPENVLHNFATCYNLRDYEHFVPLLREDFVFVFNQDDAWEFRDKIPQDGFWGYNEELEATHNMLSLDYAPEDPTFRIEDIFMDLELYGSLEESDFEGAPAGTVVGQATLDLIIQAGGGNLTLLVDSRPLFYFAPDKTQTPTVWRLWRCEDAPYDWIALNKVAGDDRPGCAEGERHQSQSGSAALRRSAPGIPVTERSSWGAVKLLYRGD